MRGFRLGVEAVDHVARRLGLDRAQISAVHAVMTWAAFLRRTIDPDDRARLRAYLEVMGYLPADRKVVAHAERKLNQGGAFLKSDSKPEQLLVQPTDLEEQAEPL